MLAFDPDNAVVAAALRRLEGRTRLRIAAAVVGIGAMLVGGVWYGAKKVARRRPAPAPAVAVAPAPTLPPPAVVAPPVAAKPPTPQPAPTTPPKRAAGATRPRPPRVAPTPVAPPPPSTEPVPARTFTLGPTPQNVDVYLDGQRLFGYDVDHTKISVPWAGAHTIEFRSPSNCCFPERITVGPDQPLPADAIIARRLKWRPGHLVVTTEPARPSARVLVRDPNRGSTSAARPGEDIDIPFFADDDSIKEIEISADDGDAFATEHVRVRAGQRLKHVLKLRAGNN